MRGLGLPLAVVALLTGCAPDEAARGVACPAFSAVDRNAPPPHLNGDPAEERLETIWRRWAGAAPEIVWRTTRPDATLRLSTQSGALPPPSSLPQSIEIVGRRGPQGWEFYTRSAATQAPPVNWTGWRPATLSPATTRRLDAVLANPCLWDAPPFLDAEVKLKNGRYDSRPDGASTLYDLSVGERRWGGWQVSWTVGEPGVLRSLLMADLYGQPDYPPNQIDPEGWLNANREYDPRPVTARP